MKIVFIKKLKLRGFKTKKKLMDNVVYKPFQTIGVVFQVQKLNDYVFIRIFNFREGAWPQAERCYGCAWVGLGPVSMVTNLQSLSIVKISCTVRICTYYCFVFRSAKLTLKLSRLGFPSREATGEIGRILSGIWKIFCSV